jgi:hypothetical protein
MVLRWGLSPAAARTTISNSAVVFSRLAAVNGSVSAVEIADESIGGRNRP